MAKFLTNSQLLGELGVTLIAKRLLDMGFAWHPSNAPLDAGIDGHVELRDPTTGQVASAILLVQSKARSSFEKETSQHVEFSCDRDDLDYWLKGNAPVLLVVSKPKDDEAYWVSVKDYFRDPANLKTRKVRFSKDADRFDASAAPRLMALASASGGGVYFTPARKREVLYTNLLRVYRVPKTIYVAETEFRKGRDLTDVLRKHVEWPEREWTIADGCLYSVHDLRNDPWRRVCLASSTKEIPGDQWRRSEEPDTQRRFVWLLNEVLRARLGRMHMFYSIKEEAFHFSATKDLTPRVLPYQSVRNKTARTVFRGYPSKKDPSKIAYYRHTGFEPRFRRYDGEWYLEINPTYLFTSDGKERHPFAEEYLSKIKGIEGDGAVGHTVVMFAALFQDPEGLFGPAPYPHLGFGELVAVNIDCGILDKAWLKGDELQSPKSEAVNSAEGDAAGDPLLFEVET